MTVLERARINRVIALTALSARKRDLHTNIKAFPAKDIRRPVLRAITNQGTIGSSDHLRMVA